MGQKVQIGVMGPGEGALLQDLDDAYKLGLLLAEKNYVTLTGGRPCGVMEAALKGAKDGGGATIGILISGDKSQASQYADIVIATDMGSARNNINILSSDVVVACGLGAGTLSEVALAIKAGRPVILLSENKANFDFLKNLLEGAKLHYAKSPSEAMMHIEDLLHG